MKRFICLLCLLVPTAAGAAAPGRPDPPAAPAMQSVHPSREVAVFSDHSRETRALPPAAIGRDAARRLTESGWPPSPPRRSLTHVGLSRQVQLAMVTRPQWEGDPLGHTRLNVGILALRW